MLFWSFYNLAVLTLAIVVCIEMPRLRRDERYPTREEVQIEAADEITPVRLIDLSSSGLQIQGSSPVALGEGLLIHITDVGAVRAKVVGVEEHSFAVQLDKDEQVCAAMIQKIHSDNYTRGVSRVSLGKLLAYLGRRAVN